MRYRSDCYSFVVWKKILKTIKTYGTPHLIPHLTPPPPLAKIRQAVPGHADGAAEEGGGRVQAEGGGEGHAGAGADGGAGEPEEGAERWSHHGPHHRAQARRLHPSSTASLRLHRQHHRLLHPKLHPHLLKGCLSFFLITILPCHVINDMLCFFVLYYVIFSYYFSRGSFR